MNKLAEICVRRPVFATMLIGFLVTLGIFSFRDLGVDLFPKADPPQVRVTVRLPGASAEEVNSQIVLPMEEAVSTVAGLEEIHSFANEGMGTLSLRFALERNLEGAANDVREKISAIVNQFPQGAFLPVIAKVDPDADPVMSIAISGNRTERELTELADKVVKRRLEAVNGVGEVVLTGGQKRQINIKIDARKLNAYGITIRQIQSALQRENVEIPSGSLEQGEASLDLRTEGRVTATKEFGEIIVANVKGTPLRIKDFAVVEDGFEEPPRSLARLDGKSAVVLLIRRQSGTNTVQVIDTVKQALERMKRELPRDIRYEIIKDQSRFIKASVRSLEEHLLLGSLCASLIVLLFMANLRAVLIASIAIPTSIISTFTLMRYMDFTLNSVTLLGVTLAVGIVIDDAIVVLENIFRHIEEKNTPPKTAAVEATREIALAVLATTLSLVVIFLPVAFMRGISARYLNQFGWTMAFSIMVSLLVSFTLTPMLCSRYLKKRNNGTAADPKHPHHLSKERGFYHWIEVGYMKMLRWSMERRAVVVVISVSVFAATFLLYKIIGQDYIPFDDQSEFDVQVRMPEGTSMEGTRAMLEKVEQELWKLREGKAVVHLLSTVNTGGGWGTAQDGNIYVRLKDIRDRDYSQFDVVREARAALRKFPSIQYSVRNPSAVQSGPPVSLIFSVRGPDLYQLDPIGRDVMGQLKQIPGFADVYSPFNLSNPEIKVKIDREKAADLGVTATDVASALRLMISGEDKITVFREGDNQYEVRMRVLEEQRRDMDVISQLMIPSSKLNQVRLDNFAGLMRGKGPVSINRMNRQYRLLMLCNLDDTKPLDEGIRDVQRTIKDYKLPPGYDFVFTGRVRDFQQTQEGLVITFLLSCIFMYMILAAQFESFLHPVTIMLSLPLSLPFALLALLATGRNLNLWSFLGVLLLLGIVKKNSILQVDYANRLRDQGLPVKEAAVEASRTRLRPILMTTFSIIGGMIPTAFGQGAGAAQRSAIAVTIIGGQLLCLLLTLLLTPVAYSLFEEMKQVPVRTRLRTLATEFRFW